MSSSVTSLSMRAHPKHNCCLYNSPLFGWDCHSSVLTKAALSEIQIVKKLVMEGRFLVANLTLMECCQQH